MRFSSPSGLWVVLIVAVGCSSPPGHPDGSVPVDAGPPCNVVDVNGNGPDDDDIQAVLCQEGKDALLCPNTTYAIDGIQTTPLCAGALRFVYDGQQLSTAGSPVEGMAILMVAAANIGTVLTSGANRVKLHHVEINGSRPGFGSLSSAGAMVEFSGQDFEISWTKLHDPRGGSALNIYQGSDFSCSGASIHHNTIGPAGCDPDRNGCTVGDPNGTWADGLSLACRNSDVHDNTVVDATGNAISVMGAPGSRVYSNHVTATTRRLWGGISLVRPGPYKFDAGTYSGGDYSGTQVYGNLIDATGARIVIGIPQGPMAWLTWCDQTLYNRGATVRDNQLAGDQFGYGLVADGVLDWTEQNNTSTASHSGLGDGCTGSERPPPAAPFLFHSAHGPGSTLQGTDVPGGIHNALF